MTTPTDELTRLREECARLERLLAEADAVIAIWKRSEPHQGYVVFHQWNEDAVARHRARQKAREDSSQAGAGDGT